MKKGNLIGKQLNQYKRSGYWNKGVALGLWVTALASVFVSEPAWAIYGGINASPGEFPSAVEINHMVYGHLCSGTIINPTNPNSTTAIYVLTAASCVDQIPPSQLYVIAGTTDRCNLVSAIIDSVQDITVHDSYKLGACTYSNDIAILRLQNPLPIGGPIQIATLPPDNSDQFEGITVVPEGWGVTSAANILPCPLQKGDMEVISTAEANTLLTGVPGALVCDSQLAVYDAANSITPCSGDRGAGLYGPLAGQMALFGVNSWGVSSGGVCLASYPYVTTRVSSYLQWIYDNTP
jgi:secreted trypsin-like serine protease